MVFYNNIHLNDMTMTIVFKFQIFKNFLKSSHKMLYQVN